MGCRLSPALTSRVGQGRHTPRNDEQMVHGPYHSKPRAARRLPFRTFGHRPSKPTTFHLDYLIKKKDNKLKLSNSLVLRMLSQHVHSFWHKKIRVVFCFGVQGLLACLQIHFEKHSL